MLLIIRESSCEHIHEVKHSITKLNVCRKARAHKVEKREYNDRERDTENESEEERKRTRDFVLFL